VIHPDSSFEERKLLTRVAWKIFVDHCLLGVGAGNYTIHYETYADEIGSPSRQYGASDERHYPHSLYLEIGAETGLLGLCIFVLILINSFVYFRRARERFLSAGNTYMAGLSKAFEISLLGYLISSIFLHGDFQRYLWVIFAYSTALYSLSETPCDNERKLTKSHAGSVHS
jgi:O-antigen ligase